METKDEKIVCPYCNSTNLAFVTEYHKCIWSRLFQALILIILIIIAAHSFPDFSKENDSLIAIAMLSVVYLCSYAVTIYVESKTNVMCICRDCGNKWLH